MADTLRCPACGRENRLGRVGCIECRAPLSTTAPPGKLGKLLGTLGSLLLLLVGGGLLAARFLLPSRMELKVQRALERETKKALEATPPVAVEAPPPREAPPPPPVAPAPVVVDDRLPLREELLRTADTHYAEGRFSQALEAYRQAQRIRKLEGEAQRRLDSSLAIFTFRDFRDSLNRGAYADRGGANGVLYKLSQLDPSLLSSDEERGEFQALQARLRKTPDVPEPAAPKPASPPRLIQNPGDFNRSYELTPIRSGDGKLRGARIVRVDPESPFAKAGVRADDVLIELHDEPVETLDPLINLVARIERKRGLWGAVRRGEARIPFRASF